MEFKLIKFEVTRFTHCEDMNGDEKCRLMWFGRHPRSSHHSYSIERIWIPIRLLDGDEKGQLGLANYETFIEQRILSRSTTSIWDRMQKLKLKNHSTWMAKKTVREADKVIKLREKRQLLARFLVNQQSWTELVPKLPTTIGDYEMSVIPRSLFANDGSLLIPTPNR